MARKAMIEKSQRTPKFATRQRNRCTCVEDHAVLSEYLDCVVFVLGQLAHKGVLPGVKKTSW